jgi:hypothetical protein
LTDDEVRVAIGALTALDMQRLLLVERRYRAATDFSEGDLLQAALCQALMRERRCPRDVGFVRTISMMMRSAGDHRRRALARQVPFDAPVVRSERGGGLLAPADTLHAEGLDPEEAVMEREKPDVVSGMLSMFPDDENVQYVILGITEGHKGAALQAATGLSSNQVHYALRKIRNRLGPDPDGWLT